MLGIRGACSRLIGDFVQALRAEDHDSGDDMKAGGRGSSSVSGKDMRSGVSTDGGVETDRRRQIDELTIRALTAVFGMQKDGKIKKSKARHVVERLGLVCGEGSEFDLPGGEEVAPEEVLAATEGGEEEEEEDKGGGPRLRLLREAFRVFDEDGNGFIEAAELKRVLQCLGLDEGWEMGEVEKMLSVVDLNLDGKVDFCEFELMMGCS